MIVIISNDAVDTLSNHGYEPVSSEFGFALILEGIGDLLDEPDELLELVNGNESTIALEGFVRNFNDK